MNNQKFISEAILPIQPVIVQKYIYGGNANLK